MKQYVFMILSFVAIFSLTTSAFCQKLRPITIGLTGKSLATVAFEMEIAAYSLKLKPDAVPDISKVRDWSFARAAK